jgi:UDP-glucose:tetrahydrobiopterin glucosyltransferase
VELTLLAILKALKGRGHHLGLVAATESELDANLVDQLWLESGAPQPSWQHQSPEAPIQIPADSLLGNFWQRAFIEQDRFDLLLNLGYDWLPLWLTPFCRKPLFHLVSMGSVGKAMGQMISATATSFPNQVAFHTASQAADFQLPNEPFLLANGFDFNLYEFQSNPKPLLGWAGRVAPEKGLEDAAQVACQWGWPLAIWGLQEDPQYAATVEASVPAGTLQWRGFLATAEFQSQLGECAAFLNTPKWNEAFGNVVVEAMACGVPVLAYRRGGPAELIDAEISGLLVEPDCIDSLVKALPQALCLDRLRCRQKAAERFSLEAFGLRLENWLMQPNI